MEVNQACSLKTPSQRLAQLVRRKTAHRAPDYKTVKDSKHNLGQGFQRACEASPQPHRTHNRKQDTSTGTCERKTKKHS